MRFADRSYNLRIELDQQNCELSPAMLQQFEKGLAPLRKPTEKFPVSDLYITVTFEPRGQVYHVKTALILSGKTMAAADLEEHPYTAFAHCVRKLVRRVRAYEDELDAASELSKQQKGTRQDVLPSSEPDAEALEQAIQSEDYLSFRKATYVYEEAVHKRIGRWIQRHPAIEAQIGTELKLEDLVEEVFLNAFERFSDRPRQIRLGEWLDQLIEPSIQLLAQQPAEELENISFVRSLQETKEPPQ